MANYLKIKPFSIENGEGIRTSIFFSGCDKHCKGCFNPETWDFNAGKEFTWGVYKDLIKPTINEHISGISILGGEPFHPKNIIGTSLLVSWFKQDFPNKTIWCWSGYRFEDIISTKMYIGKGVNINAPFALNVILFGIDVLIDGEFIEEERDLTLKWRGSKNQRVIDVQQSLKQDKVILYDQ